MKHKCLALHQSLTHKEREQPFAPHINVREFFVMRQIELENECEKTSLSHSHRHRYILDGEE